MEKPTMEKYGYYYQSGFDDQPSGWMSEGGEDAYYEALKKWEDVSMEGIIKKYLGDNDIAFTQDSDGTIELLTSLYGPEWKCKIEVISESEASICSIFPTIVPPKQRHDITNHLMRLNDMRLFGRFELLDSGEITFETHIDCTHVPFSEKILDKTLFINIATVQKYISEF